jgi:hypothetical protein
LIETSDFISFRMSPLQGGAARNKGMALFPRRINGKYAMIARQDNENLYLIYSDDLYRWDGGQAILKPQFPWEFVQIGNCGSPIELDEGWLLLTHGVGPVRKYSIGAEAQRSDHFAIRRVGHVLQFRDRQDFDPAKCDAELTSSPPKRRDSPVPLDYDVRRDLWAAKQATSSKGSTPAEAES